MTRLAANNGNALSRTLAITLGISAVTAAALLSARRGVERFQPGDRPVVLITGGGGGLGMALARRYAREGARLVLITRNAEELEGAKSTLLAEGVVSSPDDVLLLPTDLSQKDKAAAAVERTLAHFGRIDVLINAAGIILVGPVENLPIESFESAMAANFFTALYTTQSALPHLLRQAPLRGSHRASVVNISSIGGKVAVPHLLPYSASKFALTGYSEGLHAELRAKGIRVTTVCPGLMRTGSHVRAKFAGQVKKEQRWFDLGATTPGIAAGVNHAANVIFEAQQAGRAEITITPQAKLAARFAGIAPGTTATLSSLINQLVLPNPAASKSSPTPR